LRFWDTSALIPLIVEERSSRHFRDLVREDRKIVVWTLSRVEILGTLARKRREDELSPEGFTTASNRLDAAWTRWGHVFDIDAVRERAERLVVDEAISSADALQLGSALLAFDDKPRNRGFVVVDAGLARVARREGFTVFGPRS
jgi:uncharacterized protein with PIN domain